MSRLVWGQAGEKYWHAGVSKVVLYPNFFGGTYQGGVAWNGITSIDESPDGAEANDFYADNIKYASLRSKENCKGSVSAFQYPDALKGLDGCIEVVPGVVLGQQPRNKRFGMCYRTEVGEGQKNVGYQLHLIYGASFNPSDKSHETLNENPDLTEFSWDFDCLPMAMDVPNGWTPEQQYGPYNTELSSQGIKTNGEYISDGEYANWRYLEHRYSNLSLNNVYDFEIAMSYTGIASVSEVNEALLAVGNREAVHPDEIVSGAFITLIFRDIAFTSANDTVTLATTMSARFPDRNPTIHEMRIIRHRPTYVAKQLSSVTIDSRMYTPEQMAKVENVLYGANSVSVPKLPKISELATLLI